jgi:hypothetical protein
MTQAALCIVASLRFHVRRKARGVQFASFVPSVLQVLSVSQLVVCVAMANARWTWAGRYRWRHHTCRGDWPWHLLAVGCHRFWRRRQGKPGGYQDTRPAAAAATADAPALALALSAIPVPAATATRAARG